VRVRGYGVDAAVVATVLLHRYSSNTHFVLELVQVGGVV
jgi:hypothetical protein